jgi:preprotein translocase subunit SecA
MAGRGVDIILGGNPEGRDEKEWQQAHEKVVQLGGLHIVGTERHEARRIDNQLRGRAGRQGDSGSSRFYVSLEDDIVKRFGGDRIKSFMEWAGMDEDTPIENALVNKSIESAQVRVEGYHFDMRKHLVEYDDVVNKHREVIYGERKKLLSGTDLKANILSMVREEIQRIVAEHVLDERDTEWDKVKVGIVSDILPILAPRSDDPAATAERMRLKKVIEDKLDIPAQQNMEAIVEDKLIGQAEALYEEKEKELGSDIMRDVEKRVMLHYIDSLWVEHLTAMENMREGIGLQAVGQRDPLVAYKTAGHNQFQNLLSAIQHDVVHTIYHVGIVRREAPQTAPSPMAKAAINRGGTSKQRLKVGGKKIGRNDPCPCGSGKKYKHCCGR